jgi:hypothetical protein
MKTTSMPARSLDRAERRLRQLRADSDRLSPLDRLSLRVGLWLLLRSARRERSMTHEAYESHLLAERARAQAEAERVRAAFSLWFGR